MKELEQLLIKVDDDYLIGLTNKGTVKRAWKDIEKTEITYTDYENIHVDENTVSLVAPLGESTCNCPSRSICKHIIMAILKVSTDIKNKDASLETSKKKEDSNNDSVKIEYISEENNIKPDHKTLLDFPIEKAIKVIKKRSLEKLIASFKQGKLPQIEETSIVTIIFKEENMKVKLLEPVEHSSCSCHKKELCEHKAAAILSYQFLKGIITEEKLQEFLPDEKALDHLTVKNAAVHIMEIIKQQLSAGLSRTSSSVIDQMERMAVICHNAGLAEFERDFRRLKEEYELYFKRSSAFRIEELMDILTFVYNKANALENTDNMLKIRELAGEFHSEYEYIGELTLCGIGERHFHSKTGYEGEIYYFLEETSGEWYTFTNARPIFYDSNVRSFNKAFVPWELNIPIHQFSEMRIRLKNAKVTRDNRLSSSTEIKAELIGKSNLDRSFINQHYYDNFETMFQEKFEKNFGKQFFEKDKLVFVQANTWEHPIFDEIRQYFSMKLFDQDGNILSMEIKYSKEEKDTIRYLERLAKYLEKKDLKFPCFMGTVYLENGFMKLYPITYYDRI